MRKFLKSKKAMALGIVASLVVAAAAYAYFTTTGSGTGTASVGTSSNITIHGATAAALYPGTSQTVTLTADNPSSGHQKLGTVVLDDVKACPSGSSWDPSLNSGAGDCTGGQAEITDCDTFSGGASNDTTKNFYLAPVTEDQDLASGAGQSLTNNATLVMNNRSVSQDSCKNASLWLHFSSAAPAS